MTTYTFADMTIMDLAVKTRHIPVNKIDIKEPDKQKLIHQLTGKHFDENEADLIWNSVSEHKWYLSENLGRDIGLQTAAVDFIENFYKPESFHRQ